MSSLDELYNLKRKLETQMDGARREQKKYQNLAQSMSDFQKKVKNSQGEFQTFSSHKQKTMTDLKKTAGSCRTAIRYCVGMDGILDRFSAKVVGVTYYILLLRISLKLSEYRGKENDVSKRIRDIQLELEKVEQEIKAAEGMHS